MLCFFFLENGMPNLLKHFDCSPSCKNTWSTQKKSVVIQTSDNRTQCKATKATRTLFVNNCVWFISIELSNCRMNLMTLLCSNISQCLFNFIILAAWRHYMYYTYRNIQITINHHMANLMEYNILCVGDGIYMLSMISFQMYNMIK